MSRNEIVKSIRQGTQRRVEERQRIKQLKQEQREELEENAQDESHLNSSRYIPYILIGLVFLSFPLSEPNVDWPLVGCFLLLNGIWTLFFSYLSFFNLAFMIMANIALIRCSHIIPHLPRIIAELNPKNVALCVGGNLVAIIVLYFAYVERQAPWKLLTVERKKKKAKRAAGTNVNNVDALEEFARRRERMGRIDIAASVLLMGNVLVMAFLGIIPKEVFIGMYRQLMLLLH